MEQARSLLAGVSIQIVLPAGGKLFSWHMLAGDDHGAHLRAKLPIGDNGTVVGVNWHLFVWRAGFVLLFHLATTLYGGRLLHDRRVFSHNFNREIVASLGSRLMSMLGIGSCGGMLLKLDSFCLLHLFFHLVRRSCVLLRVLLIGFGDLLFVLCHRCG